MIEAALERERSTMHQIFADRVNSPIQPLLLQRKFIVALAETFENLLDNEEYTASKICEHGALTVAAYVRELKRLGLGTIDCFTPMKDQLAKLAKFDAAAVKIKPPLFEVSKCCPHLCTVCRYDLPREVNSIISNILSGCTGLCIDCTLKKTSASPDSCRINHMESLMLPGGAGGVASFAEWTDKDMQRLYC